jgi:hypothetical protein
MGGFTANFSVKWFKSFIVRYTNKIFLEYIILKLYSHAPVRPCTGAVHLGGKKNLELVGKK